MKKLSISLLLFLSACFFTGCCFSNAHTKSLADYENLQKKVQVQQAQAQKEKVAKAISFKEADKTERSCGNDQALRFVSSQRSE